MNYLRNTLFGDSLQQQQHQQQDQQSSSNNNSGISKPPETMLEKQLLDKTAVYSFQSLVDPLSESLEVIKTRNQEVIAALNLQIAELTQNCCKYEDLCEAILNHVESQIRRNQECNVQNENVNKTDENKTEKELQESKKMNQFLIYECEKHKKNLEELRREIILKQLQRVSIMETIPEEQEEIVTLRDSLSKEQERNAELNKEMQLLLKRTHEIETEKSMIDIDKAQLLKHRETLLEDNQKLKIQIVNLENIRDTNERQNLEAAQRFIKQIDVVVDENMVRFQNKCNSWKEESQKTSDENKRLLLKVLEQKDLISEFVLKDKQSQDNMHRLLVENHDLESSKKYFKCKCKRLEDDYQKLMKKYINMVDKLEEQAKEKEISDKDHQAKINNLLKNMDQFKESAICRVETKVKRLEVENQKLSVENHDFRFKMLDIAVRDIMGMNIKTENGCSVSQ